MCDVHNLKTDSIPFSESYLGNKLFELRKRDRDFKVGDILILWETKHSGYEMKFKKLPLIYTGKIIIQKVIYILEDVTYGLEKDHVIMSITNLVAYDSKRIKLY